MELEIALKFVNSILASKADRELRPPEITVFTGTWQGMTYEQMADSSAYSANYLMRDIAPKFWKLLSELSGENIGKTNLRLVVRKMYGDSQGNIDLWGNREVFKDNSKVKQQLNWGNAPSITSSFANRDRELRLLQQWIEKNSCQLLGLWGLSGSGKTLLMRNLAEQIQDRYETVIWRSLMTAPDLTELLRDILSVGFDVVENNPHKLLSRLLEKLRSHSCLILLDGIEAILQPQVFSGKYLSAYENYGEFLRIIGESSHKSCVVLTSLENPGRIIFSTSNESVIRTFKVEGLVTKEAHSLLKKEKIDSENQRKSLIEYYQGNPALLTAVAQIIRELFSGNVEEFLAQESLVFGEIDRLLDRSFARLSTLETEILYWLAGEVQPMSLIEIQAGIPFSIYPVELIEALESLTQRCLLETNQIEQKSVFTLSPMMREFVTNKFMAQIGTKFSVAKRQNSLLNENTIELGKKKQTPINLSQWLENHFETGWQPIEVLLATSRRSPARLRSAFNLRGENTIARFKQIDLNPDNSLPVLLLIAIAKEESAIKICVQAQPAPPQQILPANLELNLVDFQNKVLATIKAEARDNFIQLPYFRGVIAEKFKISLNLNSASYQENFII